MMKVNWNAIGGVFVLTVCLAPQGFARNFCSTGDLRGPYGLIASRLLLPGSTVGTPGAGGTNGEAPENGDDDDPINDTSAGRFFRGISGSNAFSSAGVMVADGAGRLFSGPPTEGRSNLVPIGTYTVNADCTLTMELRNVAGAGGDLIGAILGDGSEVQLLQTSVVGMMPPGTNGTGTPAVIPGARVTLRRLSSNICTAASLQSAYFLFGSGYTSSATDGENASVTATPFDMFGRFFANGSGTFVSDTGRLSEELEISGTYTVNPDCTGTAQLVTTMPGEGEDDEPVTTTRNVDFVVLNSGRMLEFAFTDANVVGTGTATQQ